MSLDSIYSSNVFTELANEWSEAIADYLRNCKDRDRPVLPRGNFLDTLHAAERFLDDPNDTPQKERFRELVLHALSHGIALHHPHYMGHQVGAPLPMAALFDAIAAATNQGMAIYEMGPWATGVEQAVARRLIEHVGWNRDESLGVLVSGGSLGNLTAMCAARSAALKHSWRTGVRVNATILASEEAHYSLARATGIIGLGTDALVAVPTDAERRMDPRALEATIRKQRECGGEPIAVVASCCSTRFGCFDSLEDIASVCREQKVWLHVDAAHGGGVLLSSKYRHLLAGCHLADSIVVDAHKMMFMPGISSYLMFRDRTQAVKTFDQDAEYLLTDDASDFDTCRYTVECTKRGSALAHWGTLCLLGSESIGRLTETCFDNAKFLARALEQAPDFELLHQPESNIVVFRYWPVSLRSLGTSELDAFTRKLRKQVVDSGTFYIVTTVVNGATALRVSLMNPQTTEEDLHDLLSTLRLMGEDVSQDLVTGPAPGG